MSPKRGVDETSGQGTGPVTKKPKVIESSTGNLTKPPTASPDKPLAENATRPSTEIPTIPSIENSIKPLQPQQHHRQAENADGRTSGGQAPSAAANSNRVATVPPANLPVPSNQAQYMHTNYSHWTDRDNFRGRLNYWRKRPPARSVAYHRLQTKGNPNALMFTDSHLAIVSVTEAILDPSDNTPMYGLIDQTFVEVARTGSIGDRRVLRPGRPLIMAWMIQKPAFEVGNSREQEKINKMREGEAKKAAQEALSAKIMSHLHSAAGRHIVCIVVEKVPSPDGAEGRPLIRVMDSLYSSYWEPPRQLVEDCLTNIQWFQGPPVRPLPKTALWRWDEVAEQSVAHELQPCGIHTVLNGWAVAMGLERRINTGCELEEKGYKNAMALIDLAFQGRCDWWLIYAFLTASKFVHKPPEIRALPAYPHNVDIAFVIQALYNDGARFFDTTFEIQNDRGSIESNEWMEEYTWRGMESEDRKAKKAKNNTTPPKVDVPEAQRSTPGTAEEVESNDSSKQAIVHRLSQEVQRITKSKTSPTLQDLQKTLRGCSHLAWYLRQRLHHGPISGRECATRKSFEEIALEMAGQTSFLSVSAHLQALTAVMHEILDGDEILAPAVLSRKVQAIEESRFPEEEDMTERGIGNVETPAVRASAIEVPSAEVPAVVP